MPHYSKDLDSEYKMPASAILRGIFEQLIEDSVDLRYILVLVYTRVLRLESNNLLNIVWDADLSTKKFLS